MFGILEPQALQGVEPVFHMWLFEPLKWVLIAFFIWGVLDAIFGKHD
jgi:hypothetical protein